jgi:hypothetical protein
MDLGDMMDKAKEAAKNVSDDQIEQAKEFVEGKTGDKFDGIFDKVADQAKKLND